MPFFVLFLASAITDPATGLKLDLPSEVCVYVPESQRDAGACANAGDTGALVRPNAPPVRVISQAIEKQEKGTAHITLVAIALEAAHQAKAEDLESFVSGMVRSVAKVNGAKAKLRGFNSDAKYDVLDVNNYPVVRFAILLESSAGKATQVCLLIPGLHEMLALVLSSNDLGVDALKPLADAIMPTIRMPKADVSQFAKDAQAQSSSTWASTWLFGVVAGVGAAFAITFLLVRRRKR